MWFPRFFLFFENNYGQRDGVGHYRGRTVQMSPCPSRHAEIEMANCGTNLLDFASGSGWKYGKITHLHMFEQMKPELWMAPCWFIQKPPDIFCRPEDERCPGARASSTKFLTEMRPESWRKHGAVTWQEGRRALRRLPVNYGILAKLRKPTSAPKLRHCSAQQKVSFISWFHL